MVAGPLIYAVISGDSAAGPVVSDGDTVGTYRIFPLRVPVSADQLPLIAYNGTNLDLRYTMSGPGGLVMQKAQIACLADDYDDAANLALLTRNALKAPPGYYGGIKLANVFVRDENEEELTLPSVGEDVLTYVVTLDVDIWYYQPTS